MEAGHELQSEVFLSRDVAEQAITSLREIGELFVPALLVSEMRTVRADDLWLSPAYGRDQWRSTSRGPAMNRPSCLRSLPSRNGSCRSTPGRTGARSRTLTPRRIIASYERARDFEKLMAEHDPTFKFRNDFVDRLFPLR